MPFPHLHLSLPPPTPQPPPPKQTDGIVFQPDAPYQPGTDLRFFKWKWMDTVTIDFAITPSPYKVTCGAQGGGQLDLTKQVCLVFGVVCWAWLRG